MKVKATFRKDAFFHLNCTIINDTMWSFQGKFQSENDLLKFQKLTEQAAILRKEASDERLKRIESERMVNF